MSEQVFVKFRYQLTPGSNWSSNGLNIIVPNKSETVVVQELKKRLHASEVELIEIKWKQA
jgi:hypothetical protein